MSFAEKVIHTCAPYFEENEERSFHSQVLNQEGQFLANGVSLLDPDKASGTFSPDGEWPSDKNPRSAAKLKHSDGREFALKAFVQRQHVSGQHFRFQLEP